MKRMHVHVSVDNLAESIKFYSGMFASEPTIVKTDYAKWQLDDPRVNFAISSRGAAAGVNHLGIQVESATELAEMQSRLVRLDGEIETEENTACCYAKSDKHWITDPAGIAWETFHTLDSVPTYGGAPEEAAADAACCVPLAKPRIKLGEKAPCCVPSSTAQGASCC